MLSPIGNDERQIVAADIASSNNQQSSTLWQLGESSATSTNTVTINIEEILMEREEILRRQKLAVEEYIKSLPTTILEQLTNKKYPFIASGALNVAGIMAGVWSGLFGDVSEITGGMLVNLALIFGMSNYSVFKTTELFHYNKEMAKRINQLSKLLKEEEIKIANAKALVFTSLLVMINLILVAVYLFTFGLSLSNQQLSKKIFEIYMAIFIGAETMLHVFVNGILGNMRNSQQQKLEELLKSASINIGLAMSQIKQYESKQQFAIKALLNKNTELTLKLIDLNKFSFEQIILLLQLADCFGLFSLEDLGNQSRHNYIELLAKNQGLIYLLKAKLINRKYVLQLSSTQLGFLDNINIDSLKTMFKEAPGRQVKGWKKNLWRYLIAHAGKELTSMRLKVLVSAAQHGYSLEQWDGYHQAIANWLQEGASIEKAKIYRQRVEKLNISATDAARLTVKHIDLLVESSNWLYIFSNNQLDIATFVKMEDDILSEKFNRLARPAIDLYFSARGVDPVTFINRVNCCNNLEKFNNSFNVINEAEKRKLINELIDAMIFPNDEYSQPSIFIMPMQ